MSGGSRIEEGELTGAATPAHAAHTTHAAHPTHSAHASHTAHTAHGGVVKGRVHGRTLLLVLVDPPLKVGLDKVDALVLCQSVQDKTRR